MTPSDLAPIETIARADMHYVATSLVGLSSTAAAEIALLQYGVRHGAMADYEAQLHFEKALGWRLPAEGDAETARAARLRGKFCAGTKRNLEGAVTHFEKLLQANHGAFCPPNRRGRLFNFFRDDLSVVTPDDSPYTSLVSAHYLAGLRLEQVGDLATVGPAVGRLSVGIGNVAGSFLENSTIAAHQHGSIPPFK